jgi:hypothetical protein
MGVQQFIKAALSASLEIMDAEPVIIGDETKKGVIGETEAVLDLMEGGDSNRRSITVVFPANAFTTLPRSGGRATARGETWQIRDVESGPAALRITLEEPERRRR